MNSTMSVSQVTTALPVFMEKLQLRLKQLRALQGEAREVQAWLETTKELLETQLSPPNSPATNDEPDSAVIDPQVGSVQSSHGGCVF